MRLKYQLRGLGIGIVLTAAFLMAFGNEGEASGKKEDTIVGDSAENDVLQSSVEFGILSEETGMTVAVEAENSLQMEMSSEENGSEMEMSSEEDTMMQTDIEEDSDLATIEDSMVESSIEEVLNSEENNPKELGDLVKIRIASGDDSGTVARKLQTAGLVDNASEFDAYLMQHGYDKKIAVGEKEIPINATWIEIAEKISR